MMYEKREHSHQQAKMGVMLRPYDRNCAAQKRPRVARSETVRLRETCRGSTCVTNNIVSFCCRVRGAVVGPTVKLTGTKKVGMECEIGVHVAGAAGGRTGGVTGSQKECAREIIFWLQLYQPFISL